VSLKMEQGRNSMDNNAAGYAFRVEFEDVDSYKIAHHTKLLAYLERARTRYFQDAGFNLEDLTFAVLVHKVSMRFIKPARLFDEVTVTAKIIACEDFSFTVEQKIIRGSELLVKARVTHALQDFQTLETLPVTDSFHALMGN
jgi:YbgC/YbaW family acyl-CoA thioester hydrolase